MLWIICIVFFNCYSAQNATELTNAKVSIHNDNDNLYIVYQRNNTPMALSVTMLLLHSSVLSDFICSHINKNNTEDVLITAGKWLLDTLSDEDLPLFVSIFNHYERYIFYPEKLHVFFNTLSDRQIEALLYITDFFIIEHLNNILTTYLAQHPERLCTITRIPLYQEDNIKEKIDFHTLGTFFYTHAKNIHATEEYCPIKDIFLDFNTLQDDDKKIIAEYITGNYTIKVNPINKHQIIVYNPLNPICLFVDRQTHEHYIFYVTFTGFICKYSRDGLKIEVKDKSGNTLSEIIIFDIPTGQVIFQGKGKANHNKTVIYGLNDINNIEGFHFLDQSTLSVPWVQKSVESVVFNPDGNSLAIQNNEGWAIYDINELRQDPLSIKPQAFLKIQSKQSWSSIPWYLRKCKLNYNGDGSEFLIQTKYQITTFDAHTYKRLGTINASPDGLLSKARYTKDSSKIITTHSLPGWGTKYNTPVRTDQYEHLSFQHMSLQHIGQLFKILSHLNITNDPYTIIDPPSFNHIYETIAHLLINQNLFRFTSKTKKLFEKTLQENLHNTIPYEAPYLVINNQPQELLNLYWKAEEGWRNRQELYYLESYEKSLLFKNPMPLDVLLRLFDIEDYNYNNDYYAHHQLQKIVNNSIQNLNLTSPPDQKKIDKITSTLTLQNLSYFIAALNHIRYKAKSYSIPDKHAQAFLTIQNSVFSEPELNTLFNNANLFDYSNISEHSYKKYVFNKLHVSEHNYNLPSKVLQFLLNTYMSKWQNNEIYLLEKQEDLNLCFALNQELNKPKNRRLTWELQKQNLFALSKKATGNIREQFVGKIYQRLRAKKIIQRDHLSLLHDLTLEQLNMLFRASYQPYYLEQKELDAYYNLPDACKTEKLFGRNIINRARAITMREIEDTKPSRLSNSFANIAYNVKKLIRPNGTSESLNNYLHN